MHKRHLHLALGLLAASTLIGCATAPKTAEKKAETKEAKTEAKPQKEEYVSQTSVGSWIPKKTKKSSATASEQETRDAQQAMGDLQQRGNLNRPTD